MSARASLRWWWVGLAVSVATLAGLWIGEATFDLPRVTSFTSLIPGTIIPASWMAAGLISWRARPRSQIGPLLVLVGCLYPWNPLSALVGPLAQWLFLMFGSVQSLIFVYVVLVFPRGPLTWPARVALGLGLTALLIGATSLAVKPRSERCPVCPANPLPTAHYPELSAFLWDFAAPFALVGAFLTAVILIDRWRHASPPARRALDPMLWGTFQYAIVEVYWISIGRFADGRPGTLASYSWGLIPIGIMIGMLRTRQHRSVVADLVVELGAAPQPAALRELLARTLGDPSLQLAFWLPDRQGYVDADGAAVELPIDDTRVSVLRHEGEPLAALVYDPALLEDPRLLEAVTAAARLALENSRLHAELRARLLEVRESRARLVAATDAERRRIERNLHDGAQQTLLGLRLAVRLARNDAEGDGALLDAQLAEIDAELQGAVEELRTLARGVHPAVLSDEGLAPALDALARRATMPTEVRCDCPARLPPSVEAAAYYVAAEALANVHKHAGATCARIAVAVLDGHATIEVSDDGRGGADPLGDGLRGLRDRVEALDGALRIESQDGAGTLVRAEIPCGVILADDAVVIRQGLGRLLTDYGVHVVAQVGSAEDLLRVATTHGADAAIVDIRMPPTFTDEGLRAARELRERHPQMGVLVLSQYVDVAYALKLLRGGGELTVREREVLALMAQGRTDRGIREDLFLSQKTVESHVRSIFRKLDLPASPTDNRRVHAVLHVPARDYRRIDSQPPMITSTGSTETMS